MHYILFDSIIAAIGNEIIQIQNPAFFLIFAVSSNHFLAVNVINYMALKLRS